MFESACGLGTLWMYGKALCNLLITPAPQLTSKGLSKVSIRAGLSNTRVMLSMRKPCCGFLCSLYTLLALILHLAPVFASVVLAASSLSWERCCSSSQENKVETQLASRPCRASVDCFAFEGGWRSLQSCHPGRWARSHTAAMAL